MLSPEYLSGCADVLLGMMDEVEKQALEDIARRIVKMGALTETAEFQSHLLAEQGMVFQDILDGIGRITGMTEAELRTIFEDAGVAGIETENAIANAAGVPGIQLSASPAMQDVIRAHLQKTVGAVQNLTMTTASQGQSAFIQACTMANLQVSSGFMTYHEAIKQAVKQVAEEGLSVQYPSGARDKLDVAVRRAVLTGVNQSAAKVSEIYCDEIGTDLVETTAHAGARPEHATWQGKIFSRSGKSTKYPPFESSTGYGTGAGLCGWNCRHSFHAYYEGSPRSYSNDQLQSFDRKKYEYKGDQLTEYEASQIQRKMERDIRAIKREATALNAAAEEATGELREHLQADFKSASIRLKAKENDLKNFCKQTDRRVDSVRTQVHAVKDGSGKVIGFDRSVARKATAQAKKHHDEWLSSIRADGKTSLDTIEKYHLARYNKDKTYTDLMMANKTIRKVLKKGWSDTAKEKAVENYWFLKEHGVEASDHLLSRLLSRDFKPENILEYLDKPANYKEWDDKRQRWKLIRWYEQKALVTDEKSGDIITIVVNRPNPKEVWAKL